MDNAIVVKQSIAFDNVIPHVLGGLRSELSQKQYKSTYRQWLAWCEWSDVDPMDLNPVNVKSFLIDLRDKKGNPLTKSTRMNKLAHIRKYVACLKIVNPRYSQIYDALCFMKVPLENIGKNHRDTSNLKMTEIQEIMRSISKGSRMVDMRNRLVFELGLSTGMRREEMAKLMWEDIDFDDEVIHVKSGKGDKERYVAIIPGKTVDPTRTMNELIFLYGNQTDYVFPPIYNECPGDGHVTADTIGHIIESIREVTGIQFTHHTMRRTHLTEMYRMNKDIGELKQQSGHANIDTLFKHYIKGIDARERRINWADARW